MIPSEQKKSFRLGRQDLWNILLLVVLASVLFFFRLGERGLADPEEGRYSEIAREMVESGDWITPRLNYIKRFHKPPLIFWQTAGYIKIFGLGKLQERLPAVAAGPVKLILTGHNDLIDEFVVRLAPASTAILTIVATYLLGRLMFSGAVGVMAGMVLMTTPQFFALGHILNSDMLLAALTTFSFLFFFAAVREREKHHLLYSLLLFFTLGLGMLAKGFVIFITAVFPIILYTILVGKGDVLRRLRFLPGTALFLVVALPWYVVICAQNEGLWRYLLFEQSFSRTYTTTFRSAEPIWYFIPVLAGGFFPWIMFVPYSLVKHLNFKINSLVAYQKRLLLLFIWFAAPFILFSIFPSKLMTYILPLYPPLAILVAFGFYRLLKPDPYYCKRFSRSFTYFGLSLVTAMLGVAAIYFGLKFQPRYDFSKIYINITAAALFICGFYSLIAYTYRKKYFLFGTIFSTFFCLFVVFIFLVGELDQRLKWRVVGKYFTKQIIEAGGSDDTVIMCSRFLPSVPFYLRKRIVTVDISTDTRFEDSREPLQQYLYHDIEDLNRFLNSDTPIFCIIKQDKLAKIPVGSYHTLDQIKNMVLISNRPLP